MKAPEDRSCPFAPKVKAWMDRELRGSDEARSVADHLSACPSCAELSRDFAAISSRISGALASVPPVPSVAAIVARAAGQDRDKKSVVRFLQTVAAVAALVCVVAGVLVLSTASPASGSDSSWRDSTLEVVLNDMALVEDR